MSYCACGPEFGYGYAFNDQNCQVRAMRQTDPMEAEYQSLLDELRPLGFRFSYQVSKYIVSNHLEQRYGRISGILRMRNMVGAWEFVGGIAPGYYRRLCRDLGLKSKNSFSWVTGFRSFS